MPDYNALAEQARKKDYSALAQQARESKPAESGDFASQVGDAISSFGRTINPINLIKGTAQMTAQPLDTAAGMLQAQGALVGKAQEAFRKGDWGTGTRHLIEYLIPVLGPQMSSMGDKAQQGKVGEAVGEAVGTGLLLAAPGAAGKTVTPKWTNANPRVAAAIDTVEAAGVPVSAAAKTGNQFVKHAQKLADVSFLGSRVAGKADARTAAAMSKFADDLSNQAHPVKVTGEQAGADILTDVMGNEVRQEQGLLRRDRQIADTVYPQSQTPEQAGTFTRDKLEGKTAKLGGDADSAYEPFHRAARDRRYRETVSWEDPRTSVDLGGDGTVTETMNMPVDISELVQVLEPLVQEWQMLVEPARRNASRGFTAAKSIIEWNKPYMPAELAEKALGGLKDLTRQGKYQGKGGEAFERAMRDENQGVAALAVRKLQEAIDEKVGSVDPDAMTALQNGRKLTAQKYEVADVTAGLRDEPVQAYRQSTYSQDSGVQYLRDMQQHAPEAMPVIARAYQDQLRKKIQEGKWSEAQREWQGLGAETKKILYGQNVADIDRLFDDAKQFTENRTSDLVRDRSVGLYNQLTAAGDQNIDYLRRVKAESPGQIGKISRAFLEDLWKTAREEGGFTTSKSLFNRWQDLGEATKKELFPNPVHRQKLDDFFLAGKVMSENPNPSGTALMQGAGVELSLLLNSMRNVDLWGPLASLTGAGVSTLLHSPRGVALLTRGLKMPAGSKAQAAYWTGVSAELMKIAGEQGKQKKDAGKK